ncbi:MAG: DEAD/DEAH box helicase [Pseudomonadales bacterium]
MFPRFSLRHIRDAFPAREFERGRRYFEEGRVSAFDVVDSHEDSVSVAGQVRGSGGRTYSQEIDIEWENPDTLDLFSSCTCPVGFDCRHVVAVCLMARRFLADGGGAEDATAADDRLRRWLARIADAGPGARSAVPERLIYVLLPRADGAGLGIELRVVRPRKSDGSLGKGRVVRLDTLIHRSDPPGYLTAADDEVLRLLASLCPEAWNFTPDLRGRLGHLAVERLVATGRCVLERIDGPALSWAGPRRLDLAWHETGDGRLRLDVTTEPAALVLITEPALFVDLDQALVGEVDCAGFTTEQLYELKSAPTLLAGDAPGLARLLANEFPELPVPVPAGAVAERSERHDLVPGLVLAGEAEEDAVAHELRLHFGYGGHTVPALPSAPQSLVETGSGALRLHRDLEAEAAALERLTRAGFRVARPRRLPAQALHLVSDAGTPIEAASLWSRLLGEVLPELRRDGWRVDTDPGFRLSFQPGDWAGSVEPAGASEAAGSFDPVGPFGPGEAGASGWFSLRFDLEVDGARVPLLPLLTPLLARGFDRPLPARVSLPLAAKADGSSRDHRYVDLPGERLRPFLETLRDLYDRLPEQADALLLSRFDAAAVARLEAAGTPVAAPRAFTDLAARLADFDGIERVAVPAGLSAELRGYQRQGLDWLQFLRAYELGGILADDMGLGKTLQALAHLLVEKNAGRLDRPALIVAPTSLMSNWRREAARFTPSLSVLVLQGPGREADFARIDEHDLVLTTYPLLPRDQHVLKAHAYHALILDEAQTVKNPRAKAAAVVRALDARHRLCLTGTPMENHLGELWTQFDFLLPGFLGDEESFRQNWRKPIEEDADPAVRDALARRLAPFLLRRRKQDVLDDLPPKTEILRTVALNEKQAALYESVRLAMEDRVREAIAAQGLAKSHITMLDALLKLRQICCDPRLLKLDAAREVRSSAKLELLMQMLPELLEEGRRVLVFSQFTSMLSLIEAELDRLAIGYSILTGQTRDRDRALETFRSGAVDLLLVSLKAGGVGLNLTEADTVILYDPWWNPAVEDQATDRAHRIGQTRAVFVYKLVCEATVEERILALQARKRSLADGVYDADAGEAWTADAEALRALLAP